MVMAQQVAIEWHQDLFNGNMPIVWRAMTEDFRRVVAQDALDDSQLGKREAIAIIDSLSIADPTGDHIPQFFNVASSILQRYCQVRPDMVVAGATSTIEAPAYEVAHLYLREDMETDENGNYHIPQGGTARSLDIILIASDEGQWSVAGVNAVFRPGPPAVLYWKPPAHI